MKKTLVLIIIFLCLVGTALAVRNYKGVNIDTRSNTWTKEKDWYTILDQSDNNASFSNITVDNLEVVNSPVNCLVNTGMIGTNMTISTCSNNITDWYRIGSNTVYMLGSVGIGTATPSAKLVVDGTMVVQSTSGNALINVTDTYVTFPGPPGVPNNIIIGKGAAANLVSDAASFNVVIGNDAGNRNFGTAHDASNFLLGANAGLNMGGAGSVGNVLIGVNSGNTLTTNTDNNVFIGNAATGFTDSDNSVGIGALVIVRVDGGVAIGASAITSDGVSIGYQAGDAQSTADVDNVLIGNSAGTAISGTGTDHTVVGDSAGITMTSGDENTLIGSGAGAAITTGSDNVAVGSGAGATPQGSSWIAIGQGADGLVAGSDGFIAIGKGTTCTDDGTAIGTFARARSGSTSVGYQAGGTLDTTGIDNTLIGYQAGFGITLGLDNTCIGDLACDTLKSGDGNVFIGADTDGTSVTTNSTAVGFGATCNYNNSAAFGAGASCTGDNMMAIGSPTSELDTINYGDLNATGNATINLIYAEMWNYSANDTAWTFPIGVEDVYYNFTGFTAGDINGFTFTDGGATGGGTYLTAEVDGRYKIDAAFSFEPVTVGSTYAIVISKNHNPANSRDCYARRRAGTNDVGSVSVTCIMQLATGDTVAMQIEDEGDTRDIKIHATNLNLMRIGS